MLTTALELPAIAGAEAVFISVTVPPVGVVPCWKRTVKPFTVEYADVLEIVTENVFDVLATAVVGVMAPAVRLEPLTVCVWVAVVDVPVAKHVVDMV